MAEALCAKTYSGDKYVASFDNRSLYRDTAFDSWSSVGADHFYACEAVFFA